MDEPVRLVCGISGIKELNPMQKQALEKGLLTGQNMVVAAPTASGKTLLAEISAVDIIRKGKKAVYIVPLRALASEKYEEMKKKYSSLGIRVGVSTGDMDSADHWLSDKDLIIITSEKLDSLLRHGLGWMNEIGLVIADEIHLLDSPDRGPTLEVVLTRLRQFADPRILALSATINNYMELADWLDAVAVKSDYRPVKLYRGVALDSSIKFHPEKTITLNPDIPTVRGIISDTLKLSKQALVFIGTRRNAESAAEKLCSVTEAALTPAERNILSKTAKAVENVLEHPTKQCRRLAECVRKGSAFHHAGLTNKQRKLIEEAFKSGAVKTICATPTLAAGINLPAYRTVVRDLKRFSSFKGMDWISVLEIEQMMGRAGRPKYDTEGQAILVARNEPEAEYIWENYIMGETEKIYSKLSVEPVLRMHVLSLIASGVAPTKQKLFDFFSKTFYAHQYKDLSNLNANLEKVIEMLKEFGFVRSGDGNTDNSGPFKSALALSSDQALGPTRIGKRVSELYIDPLTANLLIRRLEKAGASAPDSIKCFTFLHMISDTIDMMPLMNIRKSDYEYLNDAVLMHGRYILDKIPDEWDMEYDRFLRAVKTACLFQEWADEKGEDAILNKFGVTPGELRGRLERADWLLYAAQELGLLLNHMSMLRHIRKTRIRLRYGIREELVPLVKLKGIGRVKARKLYNSGLKTVSSLKNTPLHELEKAVGAATARKVKEQVEKDTAQVKYPSQTDVYDRSTQKTLE